LLASRGFEVVAVARRLDRLEALAKETGVAVHQLDVTDFDAIKALAAELAPTGIDALVNIAGGATDAALIEDADPDSWRAMFEVNVLGVQQMVAYFLPLLRDAARANGSADILTVTSTAGRTPYETGGGYNVAKYGATALMGVLRLELAGEPIRVIEIAPGMVKTEGFALSRFAGDTARVDALYKDVENPLSAEDVAEVIVSALELPAHINLDQVTMRPVAQAAQHKLVRGKLEPR
jgi:NADP-dependent 3-hydroxy acid dehydrogenase YdfG